MKGNQNALVHGGAAADKKISHGEPLTGIAADAQASVRADYESGGASSMVKENAERLQAASRLYWDAITAAAQAGDIKSLDTYVARFGWLASKALLAWAEVKRQDKTRGDKAGFILDAIKEAENDKG
jgi:hypothetical protein